MLGARIREQRQRRKLTQRELCRLAKISVGFLSDVENEKRSLSAENLFAVSRVLGQTMDWFFNACDGRVKKLKALESAVTKRHAMWAKETDEKYAGYRSVALTEFREIRAEQERQLKSS